MEIELPPTLNSKSTDKLKSLLAFAASVPYDQLRRVKSVRLTWKAVGVDYDEVVVPEVFIEFNP